ncbi:hypothetical protein B0H99_103194 [Planomicrobium soli]|uniref:Uncharacterized protein n=1 Tax=Planomicrobium soli TaxID=1176648 RepID=A0A2P8H4D6_9BACL|nr:hypothetical protein B0H99_103194 [Planomicrobium soli]
MGRRGKVGFDLNLYSTFNGTGIINCHRQYSICTPEFAQIPVEE